MRAIVLETLYEWSKIPYQKWFKKNTPWELSIKDLLQFKPTSLGFHLGSFLLKHNFSPQPKLEVHDVYHVLTNIGITVPEEIAMQYYLLGNGKRSLYLFGVLFLGTLLYPDNYPLFRKAYNLGNQSLSFYRLDFKNILPQPITKLRSTFLIQTL